MTVEHSLRSVAEDPVGRFGGVSAREAAKITRARWLAPMSAALCFVLASVLWLGPMILRADLFNGDAAHHVYWFYQVGDPELLQEEVSIEYFATSSQSPIAYRTLYSAIAPVVDVLTAAEWLSVPLLGATALLAYLIGYAAVPSERYRSVAGLACTVACLALLDRMDLLPPLALQRTFALPIVLLCLWALVARRYTWVGVSWLLAATIYPVVMPVLGLSACIVFAFDLLRTRRMPPKWVWNGVLGVTSLAIVLSETGMPDGVGPMVTFAEAQQMAEFGRGGRQSLFGSGWHENLFLHHRTGLGISAPILLGGIVMMLCTGALRRWSWVPLPAVVLAAVGVGLWAIARLVMFDLYLPNRHSRWALAAVLVVVVGVSAAAMVAALHDYLRQRAGHLDIPIGRRLVTAAAALAPAIIVASLYPSFERRIGHPVDVDLERAYAFLETLPKDTLVAAHPDLASYVPLRSKRAVLASTEASVAFARGYYARYVPRIEASLDAAYATSWDALDERLAPYGVDVVLGNSAVLADTSYHPPFDERVARLTRDVTPEQFVMRAPPPDRLLFRSGDTVIVEVRKPVAPSPMAGAHE